MMIVVPAFPEREQRKPPVVARIVARGIAPRAQRVGERIDREGGVVEHHRGNAESPHQQLQAVGPEPREGALQPCPQSVQSRRQRKRRNQVEAIEEAQFRITGEVPDQFIARGEIAARQEPHRMRPQEAVAPGRMHVVFIVGMPRSGTVREVAVVEAGDGEHAHEVQAARDEERNGAAAGPEYGHAGQMQQQEGNDAHPVDAAQVLRSAGGKRYRGTVVEPACDIREHPFCPGHCHCCGTLMTLPVSYPSSPTRRSRRS